MSLSFIIISQERDTVLTQQSIGHQGRESRMCVSVSWKAVSTEACFVTVQCLRLQFFFEVFFSPKTAKALEISVGSIGLGRKSGDL